MPGPGALKPVDYRAVANAVLLDRQGRRTWPLLEMLEERAQDEPRARRELVRLELLNEILELREAEGGLDAERTARLVERLDGSPDGLAREGWRLALAGRKGRARYRLLSCSRKGLGWEVLGLPPAFARREVNGLQDLEENAWRGLLERRVEEKFQDLRSDRTFQEYARLKAVAELLGSHPLSLRVDRRAVVRDRDALAERLIRGVAQEVRPDRLLGWAAETLLPSGGFALGAPRAPYSRGCGLPPWFGEGALHSFLSLQSLFGAERLAHTLDGLRQGLGRRSTLRLEPILNRVATSVQSQAWSRHRATLDLSMRSTLGTRLQSLSGTQLESSGSSRALEKLASELTFEGVLRDYRLSSAGGSAEPGSSPLV